MAAAFPKLGAAWLAPIGLAALFWTWQGASLRRAVGLGFLAGIVFFTIAFAWVGHTVGAFIGYFAPFLPLGIAVPQACSWAAAGALAWAAYRYARPNLAPLAAAAAFTICEWLRSIGTFAVPFDQMGYTQADTVLKAIAAYAGTLGITFALCVLAAYAADALRRRAYRPFVFAAGSVAALTALAWAFWPARTMAQPTIPVAAVQGNIAQSLKWNSLTLAVDRYSKLTRKAATSHPKLIVWPETVIPTDLNVEDVPLRQYFQTMAEESHATIVAGALDEHEYRPYNGLFVLQPDGSFEAYDKRQLVPFAEWFPLKSVLGWIPYIDSLNGRITPASKPGVYPTTAGLKIGPLICWESAFSDLMYDQLRRGAQLLVVSTDDAWFGTTSGPYMHAQISQLRAIESGAYVVRAAATGISGIVAPDGRWQARSKMEEQKVVRGFVGPRVQTVFSRIGPAPPMILLAAWYVALLFTRHEEHAEVA